jgi:hypothetical protein
MLEAEKRSAIPVSPPNQTPRENGAFALAAILTLRVLQYGQMDQQNQQQPQVFTPGEQPQPEQQVAAPLQYNSGQLEQLQASDASERADDNRLDDVVRWSASEFIAHEKNGSWFAMLIAGAIILGIIVFIVTREWFSLVAIAVLAVAIGVFGKLSPRVLNYQIAPDGITVGEKHFGYEIFTSFAVIEDGAMTSLQLLPQKRFMVPITLYLDPAQVDEIIETLGEYLPFEHRERDFTDRISSRFRF